MAIRTKHFKNPIVVKRKRPRKLSDPYRDYHPPYPTKLLETQDHEMGYQELKQFFGPHITAGTYEEVIYFLPLAYDRIRTDRSIAWDLIRSVVWFISEYSEELGKDHLLVSCRSGMSELLGYWTSQFEVDHFDKAACQEKGWGSEYEDHVVYSNLVRLCLTGLYEYEKHRDRAVTFCDRLIKAIRDPYAAAWLLELWRSQGDIGLILSDPKLSESINNMQMIKNAAETIQGSSLVGETGFQTYWPDLFTAIKSLK